MLLFTCFEDPKLVIIIDDFFFGLQFRFISNFLQIHSFLYSLLHIASQISLETHFRLFFHDDNKLSKFISFSLFIFSQFILSSLWKQSLVGNV